MEEFGSFAKKRSCESLEVESNAIFAIKIPINTDVIKFKYLSVNPIFNLKYNHYMSNFVFMIFI